MDFCQRPSRVTPTFTDVDLEANEYDVAGFEADEMIGYCTRRGQETCEFQITDFREDIPGRVHSALVDKLVDGKLWIEVEADSVQSSHDGLEGADEGLISRARHWTGACTGESGI